MTTAPSRVQRRPLVQTTSRSAFRERSLKPGGVPDRILTYLRDSGGACDFEIERALGLSHQSVSGERRHLVERGLVHATTEKRLTPSGFAAIVWKAGRAPDAFQPADVPPVPSPNSCGAQLEMAEELA